MSEVLSYCENHPDRETSLRCNRCNKLICSQCAIQTPTGYRCEECVHGQQKVFNTAQTQDYVLSFAITAFLSYIAALIASRIGLFTIFLAPAAGTIIAEAVRRVVNRRRSKQLFQVALGGIVLGAVPFLLFPFLGIFFGAGLSSLFSLLWPGLYLAIAASTAYYRMSGIQLGR